jgi:hypothetical protein
VAVCTDADMMGSLVAAGRVWAELGAASRRTPRPHAVAAVCWALSNVIVGS